ncbi:Vgb family protein [Novosphingobium huizhouense]|uniref:Vgb family protein n=1 Tax=Novosphingobium huizhouense TaxID=2866625 RepID=UPI001CD872B9|nr:YncE family protein [Novosphingobium huizhouense]
MRRIESAMLAAAAAVLAPAAAHAEDAAPAPQVQVVPGFADFLAIDGPTVWATNKGRVEQWSTKGKLAEAPMGRPCGGMSVDFGSLWVADCPENAVKRIDVKTGKLLATISSGIANQREGELNTVTGAGAVWIGSDAAGKIARIDPATNTVVASVTVAPGTWYLSFGLGALWAVSAKEQLLQRIDPATNAVTGTAPLGKAPGFLVAGEGAVWVQEQGDGTVARIDPATMAVTARIKVGDNLKWGDIDTGAGKVWLRTTDDQEYVVIDAATNAILSRVGKPVGSGALRWTPRGVWTSAHDVHTLTWWPSAK